MNDEPLWSTLISLIVRVGSVSLFAVGGGVSILIPQLHDVVVGQLHWMNDRSFAELLAVAQAAPGPNFLLIPLIGWRVAGWAGAIVGLVSFLCVPVSIAFVVGRVVHDRENALIVLLRRAFRPVTSGMWIAAGVVIAHATDRTAVAVGVTFVVAGTSLFVELSPLWWCLGAGVIGALIG
jgi:chromate transporter